MKYIVLCLKKPVVQSVEKFFRLHTTSIYVVFGYGERFQQKKDCLEQFRIYIAAFLLEPAAGPMVAIMVVAVEKERYDNNVRLYSDRMKLRVVQPASVRITSVSH